MSDGKCGGLLGKAERKFPNQNDGRVNENRKRSILKFAGEIAADPRIRTEQREMTFGPTARDIGKDRQDRQFIIVIPKCERVAPKEEQAKENDNKAGCCSADYIDASGSRRHLAILTPAAQCPTPNLKFRSSAFLLMGRWRSDVRRFLVHSTTGLPSVITRTLSSIPWLRAAACKRWSGSSSGS